MVMKLGACNLRQYTVLSLKIFYINKGKGKSSDGSNRSSTWSRVEQYRYIAW